MHPLDTILGRLRESRRRISNDDPLDKYPTPVFYGADYDLLPPLREPCVMRRLGLVGGISWVSTIEYYRLINEGVNAKLGGLQFADCLIHSLNFGEVQERGWPQAEGLLVDSCRRLQAGGADAIVLCANTAHLHAAALRAATPLPIIDIVEATVAEVIRQGHTTVGVLGTKFVMESDLYGQGFRQAGITALVPDREVARDRIQHTIKEELGRGLLRDETKVFYLAEMDALRARGATGIVLGCTEIPLLINQDDHELPLFDTLKLHAAAAVRFALAG
jgi:aspartate racemase